MIRKIIRTVLILFIVTTLLSACAPSAAPTPEIVQATAMPATVVAQNGFQDKPAIPNNSGVEGVQTFPDKSIYHNHVRTLDVAVGEMPPVSGAHFAAWQNCGIYDQPVELGSALHSMEHGAVWLTYRPDLAAKDVSDLQALVRAGHGYVLMSPYATQKKDVVLTAWGVQLVIDSLPDLRIAKFIAFFEQGPQDSEPGAPCSGALGSPLP